MMQQPQDFLDNLEKKKLLVPGVSDAIRKIYWETREAGAVSLAEVSKPMTNLSRRALNQLKRSRELGAKSVSALLEKARQGSTRVDASLLSVLPEPRKPEVLVNRGKSEAESGALQGRELLESVLEASAEGLEMVMGLAPNPIPGMSEINWRFGYMLSSDKSDYAVYFPGHATTTDGGLLVIVPLAHRLVRESQETFDMDGQLAAIIPAEEFTIPLAGMNAFLAASKTITSLVPGQSAADAAGRMSAQAFFTKLISDENRAEVKDLVSRFNNPERASDRSLLSEILDYSPEELIILEKKTTGERFGQALSVGELALRYKLLLGEISRTATPRDDTTTAHASIISDMKIYDPYVEQLARDVWSGEWEREDRMAPTEVRAAVLSGKETLRVSIEKYTQCSPSHKKAMQDFIDEISPLSWLARRGSEGVFSEFASSSKNSPNRVTIVSERNSINQLSKPFDYRNKPEAKISITNAVMSPEWKCIEMLWGLSYSFSKDVGAEGLGLLSQALLLPEWVLVSSNKDVVIGDTDTPPKHMSSRESGSNGFFRTLIQDPEEYFRFCYNCMGANFSGIPNSRDELLFRLTITSAFSARGLDRVLVRDVPEEKTIKALVENHDKIKKLTNKKYSEISALQRITAQFIDEFEELGRIKVEDEDASQMFDAAWDLLPMCNIAIPNGDTFLDLKRATSSLPHNNYLRIVTEKALREDIHDFKLNHLTNLSLSQDDCYYVALSAAPATKGWKGVAFAATMAHAAAQVRHELPEGQRVVRFPDSNYSSAIVGAANRCTAGALIVNVSHLFLQGDLSVQKLQELLLNEEREDEAINVIQHLNQLCCFTERPLSIEETELRIQAYIYTTAYVDREAIEFPELASAMMSNTTRLAKAVMAEYEDRDRRLKEERDQGIGNESVVQEVDSVPSMELTRDRATMYYALSAMQFRSFREARNQPFSTISKRIEKDYDKLPVAQLIERSIDIVDEALEAIPFRSTNLSNIIFSIVNRAFDRIADEVFPDEQLAKLSHERREELVLGCALSFRKLVAAIASQNRSPSLEVEFRADTDRFLFPIMVGFTRSGFSSEILKEEFLSIASYSTEEGWSEKSTDKKLISEISALGETFRALQRAMSWREAEEEQIRAISRSVVALENKIERGRQAEAVPGAMLRGRNTSSIVFVNPETRKNLTLQVSRQKGRSTVNLFTTGPLKKSENSLLARELDWPSIRKPWGYLESGVLIDGQVERDEDHNILSGAPMVGGIPYGWHFTPGSSTLSSNEEHDSRRLLLERLPALHSKISHEVGVRCHHLFKDKLNFRHCDVVLIDADVYLVFERRSSALMKLNTGELSLIAGDEKRRVLDLLEASSDRYESTEIIQLVNPLERQKQLGWRIDSGSAIGVLSGTAPREDWEEVNSAEGSNGSRAESHDVDIDDPRRSLLLGVLSSLGVKELGAYGNTLISNPAIGVHQIDKGRVLFDVRELDCVFLWLEESGRIYFIPDIPSEKRDLKVFGPPHENELVPEFHAVIPPWNEGDIGAWLRNTEEFIANRQEGLRYPIFPTHAVTGRYFSLAFEDEWYETEQFRAGLERDLRYVSKRRNKKIGELEAKDFRPIPSGEHIWSIGGPGAGETFLKRLARGFRFVEGVNLRAGTNDQQNEVVQFALNKLAVR